LSSSRCLIVFVRYPEAGKVKSRLARDLGGEFVADLYGKFVDDILDAVNSPRHSLRIAFDPPERSGAMRDRFGSAYEYRPQIGDGLGERMENAFRQIFAEGFGSVLLMGSDCPEITGGIIEDAFCALETGHDAVLGPALDGGYYLIGFKAAMFQPGVFRGIAWGGARVLDDTMELLRERNCRIHLSALRRDVDDKDDLLDLMVRHASTPFDNSRTMAFLRRNLADKPARIP
jgi:rSAM/selenodomain-associated transferase 1